MMILAGDIGGTNTRLAVYEIRGDKLYPLKMESFPSQQFERFDSIVQKFNGAHNFQCQYACFGVAGPIKEGQAKVTNLKWDLTGVSLEKILGLKKVKLINDLEANAYGINELTSKDLLTLNEGSVDITGNGALIAAGTGLGEAGLFNDSGVIKPVASEGGHVSFAPRNDLEFRLLQFLQKEYGHHVSYERLLSGPGLHNMYNFFSENEKGGNYFEEKFKKGDPAKAISQAAMDGENQLAVASLNLFLSIYGSEAGNLALKFMATGGIYIGGGIAPQIVEKFKVSDFMLSFVDKGRMKPLLEAIPVRIILNDKTALLGAARVSAILARREAKF